MRVCIIKNAEADKISDVYRIVNALIDDGHECIIISRNRNSDSNNIIKKNKYINNHNIYIYEISIKSEIGAGIKNISNLIKYIKTVRKWLIENKDKYDAVHAFDLDAGLATLQAYKRTSKPYVYHIADFYVDSRGGIPTIIQNYVKNLEFKVINNAETTIICTEQREEQIEGSNPKNLVVVHNTPGIKAVADIEKNINQPIKLTYIGGLSENRFIKELIEIVKNDSRFLLTIAGAGPLKNYAEDAAQKYANVNFLGQVLYKDAIEEYKKCDVIFAVYNPTIKNHKYSAPNKFYEALMLGKAIIVSKNTGVDKLVEKENIGITCEYEKKSIKNALELLYGDRDRLQEYKNNSIKNYYKYSEEEMNRRLINIYNSINAT